MFKIININITPYSEFKNFISNLKNVINKYPYDQYKNYPSKNKTGWIYLYMDELEQLFHNPNFFIFYDNFSECPVMITYFLNKWDENHFGIKMAKSIKLLSLPDTNIDILSTFINKGLEYLTKLGVKFVSVRINGDNISLINAYLENNFKYYETIIWPILDTKQLKSVNSQCNILTDKIYLKKVMEIAENYQYQRGHFHCDIKFDKSKVNAMYAKWLVSSFYSNDKICIIESDNNIAGYFICAIDPKLEKYFGYKYGRLKSLALNEKFRGIGLGKKLFEGTLNYLKNNECIYIDSGYASKNHTSAFLHTRFGFYSIYEELTLHKWLE